ncbi:hypothetical protein JTE90_024906 [Oedothorax gibbosus]|uniref:FAS1 domain-containing protein n=1 Tax=Oedothorax gibbosus TaxID=931172 RepID=A0AAV6U3A4_9ARAC|nr:hypothetical protein JTE90_024906 [Oedothorax gibbosus]
MGATEFVSMADEASMTDTLHTGNYTIFCPLNSALESFIQDEQFEMGNEILVHPHQDRIRPDKKLVLQNLLTDHMVSGFHKMDDFRDRQLIQAAHQDSHIRMNVYHVPEKVVTANCVPVLSGDHFARNGIIHVIEKVLPVPSRSVADIIAGDSQFSVLKGLLSRAGLVQTLRNTNRTFTIFAPTNHAFIMAQESIPTSDRCIVSSMKHHIVDHVICSSAIPQFAKSLNLVGELLALSRDDNNKLFVEDVQMVARDIMATNGVVHVIDGLLTTRQAKGASQILDDYGLTEFSSLLEVANLKTLFDSFENVTFFVPSNEAIKAIPPGLLDSLVTNIDSLFSILLYHVADGQAEPSVKEQVLSSKLDNTSIRVQVHAPYPHANPQILVQCATVLSAGNKMCGGSLHIVNKLLLPPKLSILQVLEGLEGFSTLVMLLKATGLDRRLGSAELGRYTFLAPTDDAFHMRGEDALFSLMDDRGRAADILRMHIISGTVCCSQLKSDLLSGRPHVRTIDGSILKLDRYREGSLRIGGGRIVDCDIMATNGVIHMVDTIVRHEDFALGTGFTDNVLIRI